MWRERRQASEWETVGHQRKAHEADCMQTAPLVRGVQKNPCFNGSGRSPAKSKLISALFFTEEIKGTILTCARSKASQEAASTSLGQGQPPQGYGFLDLHLLYSRQSSENAAWPKLGPCIPGTEPWMRPNDPPAHPPPSPFCPLAHSPSSQNHLCTRRAHQCSPANPTASIGLSALALCSWCPHITLVL